MIKIRYFARLREHLGTADEQMALTPEIRDLAALTEQLRRRGGVWSEAFGGEQSVMMAVNEEVADAAQPLRDGDEVAYFPPVTGG